RVAPATPASVKLLLTASAVVLLGVGTALTARPGGPDGPEAAPAPPAARADPAPAAEADPAPPPAGAGRRVRTTPFTLGEACEAAALSPDGKFCVTGGVNALRVFDAATGRPLHDIEGQLMPHGLGPRRWFVAISPDSRTLASADENSFVHFWDLATGKEL